MSVRFLPALLLLILPACAAPAEEVGETAPSAIQAGRVESNEAPYSVFIANTEVNTACSGTLIAPNLVVTARHCVVPPDPKRPLKCGVDFGDPAPASQLAVSDQATARNYGAWRDVVSVLVPDERAFCGDDIALVIVKDAYEARTFATPLLSREQMFDRAVVDREITAVGYGLTSNHSDDWGTRRLREHIPITCVRGDTSRDCQKSKYQSGAGTVASTELLTAGGVCEGDSGGSAIEQRSFGTSQPLLIGVASRIESSGSTCGAARYTRTDAFASFIIAGAQEAARIGGYEAPSWSR